MPKLLSFVEKTDPILREIMPSVQDFSDPVLHEAIKDMCYSILPAQLAAANAAHKSAAGMAANQWGINKRVFIFTPDGSGINNPMEIMLNPSYMPYLRPNETEPELLRGYEGCFSVPLTTGIVSRYAAIIATWYTPDGVKIERIMDDWEARVFQHETDHLNGMLFDGQLDGFPGPVCQDRVIFKDKEDMDNFRNPGE